MEGQKMKLKPKQQKAFDTIFSQAIDRVQIPIMKLGAVMRAGETAFLESNGDAAKTTEAVKKALETVGATV
jgi:hypothetical protein